MLVYENEPLPGLSSRDLDHLRSVLGGYVRPISSANLQQAVTSCHLTGAQRAFLVVPAGHDAAASYTLIAGKGSGAILVEVVEMAAHARSIDEWRTSAAALVSAITASASGWRGGDAEVQEPAAFLPSTT